MPELMDLAEQSLADADPDEQLEAFVVHRTTCTIQVDERGDLRSLEQAEVRGLGVRLICRGRVGYASTSNLSAEAIARVVRSARDNARATDIDLAQGLPQPSQAPPVTGLLDPRFSAATLSQKTALLADVARRVVTIDRRVESFDTCELRTERLTTAIASTEGVRAEDDLGYVELYCDAVAADANGRAGDYAYRFARCIDDLDIDKLVADTVDRSTRLLGRPLDAARQLPLILDRVVVAELLGAVGRGISGGAMNTGSTPFADRMGTSVAAPAISLLDLGRSLLSPSGSRFDDEGVPRRDNVVIRDGTFVWPLHSTITATAMGGAVPSTGNARRGSYKSSPGAAPSALSLTPTVTAEALPRLFPDGLYVQQLSGARSGINQTTGRVEVGAEGWLWRDGEPAGRFSGLALSSDLIRILTAVIAVADDHHHVPWTSVLGCTVVCAPDCFDRSI